ncbi:MAG: phospholipid carrier-dependent glycosyltransferase [Anaerolineales bacterium]|nr:phospholipid carrier-dependent glycosyltransferase [Anaerolineales bacterium]
MTKNNILKYSACFFILLSAVLGLLRFNSLQIGTSYDDAHYIILAESISSGQGYQLINFPRPQAERAFPPGWSLLLAPLTFLFPGNYSALKFFSLTLSLASIVLAYKIFSKRLSSPYLEILTGLAALNPLLVGTSVTIMSESAYLFFSLLAVYCFDIWQDKPEEKKLQLIIQLAVIVFYTQLIRTIGISLFIALVLYLLFTRRFRDAGIAIGVFITGTLLQGWLSGTLISSGYRSQVFNTSIPEKIGQMSSNAIGYLNETLAGSLIPVFGSNLTSFFSNYGLQALPILLNIIILAVIMWGAVSRKTIELMDVYLVIYLLGILAFWNPRVGSVKARFLIPIIPFLYFYFLNGMMALSKKKIRVLFASFAFIVVILLARNLQDWRNPVMNQMSDLSIGTSWVAENAPPDAIVMVNEPVPAYPHARRKTVSFPRQSQQNLEAFLTDQDVDYIVIAPRLQSPRSTELDGYIRERVLPVIESAPERFIMVYFNTEHNVTVYRYTGQ